MDSVFVCDLAVVLFAVLSAKYNDGILPLVANPAFTALHARPLGCSVNFEMCVLGFSIVEDELWMSKFTCDYKRLN